jgi:mRNA interferase MazF
MRYIPARGDVIWLTFSPQAGHEQAGRRPAVVLSPKYYNGKVGMALLCPVTHQIKGYDYEVRIPEGFAVKGVILSDHIKSVDWQARDAVFITELPDDVIELVLAKLRTLLE